MKKYYSINPVGLLNSSKKYNENEDYYQYENSSFNYKYDPYLSNVCYINSSIQCLFHLKQFPDLIIDSPGKPLITATRNLLIEMIKSRKEGKSNLTVKEIKEQMGLKDDRYNNNHQEDANEFISNFLDALHEETINKSCFDKIPYLKKDLVKEYEKFYNKFYGRKGHSIIFDLFYGNYITKKSCKKCGKSSYKFSAFNMIELPIYDLAQRKRYSTYNTYSTLDINEVLSSYFSESKIDGAKCECGEDIYSKTSIFKLPKILIVFFGRTVNGQYISNKISYSEILDLKNYLYDKSISNDYKYSLSGVIHYISFGKKLGHYTASCQCDDGWYYFDDSMVTKVQNLYPNEIILFYENKS